MLTQYNSFICNKYTTSTSYCEEEYEQSQFVLPNVCKYQNHRQLKTVLFAIICVVNARTVVEDYEFDEYNEIQCVDAQQQESSSLSDFSPSYYLKHQQTIYSNKTANEDTAL